ncbi:MAG: endonuclease/exonuclease/phosphatase family protein, partial [Thermodesulfobacteriota bacterium]
DERQACRALALAALLALALAAPAALAADQTLLGQRLLITDRDPDEPARRRIVLTARERQSANVLTGDPTVAGSDGGALLQIVTAGGTPVSRVLALPQGVARSGKPFWRATAPHGFRYSDPRGENGPVTSLVLRKSPNGLFSLRVVLSGRNAPLDVVPPNPGTQADVTLSLAGGDRYCVAFGPDGVVKNDGGRSFTVAGELAESCPAAVDGELLALSYNVAGLPQGISGSNPATNTQIISPLLNGYDLVLVQESWQTPEPNPLAPLRVYHEVLVADALHPFKSIPATHPFNSDPTRPQALLGDGLNRMSRFPFEPVTRVRWSGCHNSAADCLALKGFSYARTTLAPGVEVDVYNLHMEAGGDPEDDVLRDQGVSQLRDAMNTVSAGRAVIVGGDFNLHSDVEPDKSQYERLLAEAGLTDACAAVGCPSPGRIDKFAFRSGGGVTLAALSWRFETDVFVDPMDEPLSDHDALAVRFAWSAP